MLFWSHEIHQTPSMCISQHWIRLNSFDFDFISNILSSLHSSDRVAKTFVFINNTSGVCVEFIRCYWEYINLTRKVVGCRYNKHNWLHLCFIHNIWYSSEILDFIQGRPSMSSKRFWSSIDLYQPHINALLTQCISPNPFDVSKDIWNSSTLDSTANTMQSIELITVFSKCAENH